MTKAISNIDLDDNVKVINSPNATNPKEVVNLQQVQQLLQNLGSINTHSDVDTTTNTPSVGDLLAFDGTNFVPITMSNGFTIFPIWAEESGALSNNNRQWSFGNGATGNINITIPFDCEIFAMSLEAEIGGTSVSIELMKNDLPITSQLFNGDSDFATFTTPFSVTAGERIGFRTDIETGAYTDVRVVAWFRIRSSTLSTSVLNDLLDVSIGGIQNGQLLQFNGSNFVPYTLPDLIDRVYSSVVTDSTTNVANASYANIPIFGLDTFINDNGSFTTLTVDETRVNFDGFIEVNLNISFISFGGRATPEGRLAINGTLVGPSANTGYIRSATGHNESSHHLSGVYLPVSNGDIISYQTQRESTNTSSITMQANQGQISIRRVKS